MADHDDFLNMAREMIAEEGREVSFVKLSATAADPAKPWRGAGVPTTDDDVTTYAVFVPHVGELDLGKMITDNELFKASEQVLLVAPPVTGEVLGDYHAVVDGGARWKINVTRELKPGPLTVLYVMGVSR